jgi:hypothetical protein
MKTQEVQLTKGEIYLLHMSILAINEKNKEDKYFDKNFNLVKKVLAVKKELSLEWESITEAKLTIDSLFTDKELIMFQLPIFTEEDFEKMNFDVAKTEAFEKLLKVK